MFKLMGKKIFTILANKIFYLDQWFVYVDALCSSQQFIRHVVMFSCLPGLNQYKANDNKSCS